MRFIVEQTYTPEDSDEQRRRKVAEFESKTTGLIPLCKKALLALKTPASLLVEEDVIKDNIGYDPAWAKVDQSIECILFSNNGMYEISIEPKT